MTIRASCGHYLTYKEDLGFVAAWKSYARDGSPAVSHGVLCGRCLKEYEKEGLLLKTESEQMDWICRDEETES